MEYADVILGYDWLCSHGLVFLCAGDLTPNSRVGAFKFNRDRD